MAQIPKEIATIKTINAFRPRRIGLYISTLLPLWWFRREHGGHVVAKKLTPTGFPGATSFPLPPNEELWN
jgi:hypothetical protein